MVCGLGYNPGWPPPGTGPCPGRTLAKAPSGAPFTSPTIGPACPEPRSDPHALACDSPDRPVIARHLPLGPLVLNRPGQPPVSQQLASPPDNLPRAPSNPLQKSPSQTPNQPLPRAFYSPDNCFAAALSTCHAAPFRDHVACLLREPALISPAAT
ncbi:unnamed protein product [Calypogeia fissa]